MNQQHVAPYLRGGNPERKLVTPYTSEDMRIGNLGPGIFAVIFIGIIVVLLCFVSNFLEKPKSKVTARCAAFGLVLITVVYFSASSYESDADNLSENRQYDETFTPRFGVALLSIILVLVAIGAYVGAAATPLQGRMIRQSDGKTGLLKK